MIQFEVTEEYIELIKLLKLLQIADSGATAKAIVENEEVVRNGSIETRKRAKIRKGETIQVLGETIVTI
jgi:ribosome-associated protein